MYLYMYTFSIRYLQQVKVLGDFAPLRREEEIEHG